MDTKNKIFYWISIVLNILQIYYAIWLIYTQIIENYTYNGDKLMSDILLYISIVLPFIVAIVNIIILIKDRKTDKKLTIFNYICIVLEPCKAFQYTALMQGLMAILNKLIFDRI